MEGVSKTKREQGLRPMMRIMRRSEKVGEVSDFTRVVRGGKVPGDYVQYLREQVASD